MSNVLGCGFLMGVMMAIPLAAQQAPQAFPQGHLDVAVTYNSAESNGVGNSRFWLQGGSVQVHDQFLRGFGVVVDVGGLHTANINSSGVGLDLVTATFGGRYTWSSAHNHYSLYGQGLVGVANGMNSVFPNPANADTSANGMAVLVGGGVNVKLTHHVALRAIEANWLRTDLPNATTNVEDNLRLGAGLVFHFR